MSSYVSALAGVGDSSAPDAGASARAAVHAALAGTAPAAGDLVLVFASSRYDVEAVHRAAAAAAAPATVIGCTSSAAFTHDAQVTGGCVAAYLPAAGASFGVAHVERLGDDIAGAARRAAETARERSGDHHPHAVLLMLSDGLAGDQREIVRGAYEVTGAVIPLIGGAAGDDFAFERTHQFSPDGVSTNGLVAVWISSPRPLGVGVGHGWRPIGRPLLVTRADGRVVHELDGRPALAVYLEAIGERADADADTFAGRAMEHPLGRTTVSGGYEVCHALDRHGDGLMMVGHLPEGALVQVMAADEESLLEGARAAAEEALNGLDGTPRVALTFSCGARFARLGDRRAAEAERVSQALGGAPMAGFFTYGEFARIVGPTGFHNATVVVLALP